jgi:hypothetical protein
MRSLVVKIISMRTVSILKNVKFTRMNTGEDKKTSQLFKRSEKGSEVYRKEYQAPSLFNKSRIPMRKT